MERQLLNQILSDGASFARLHFRTVEKHTLDYADGAFTSLSGEMIDSVRVMVISGKKFLDKTYDLGTGDNVTRIAADLCSSLASAPEQEDLPAFEAGRAVFSDIVSTYDVEEMKAFLLSLRDEAAAAGAELTDAGVSYEIRREHSLSSLGEEIRSDTDGYTFSYHAAMTRDGRSIDPFASHASCRRLADAPGIDPVLAQHAGMLFDAAALDQPFTGDLIIAPDYVYYMLMDHLFGQLFEDNLLAGDGAWCHSFGQTVTSERFSAALDPFSPGVVFGERINAAGRVSAGYDLIRNGILKNGVLSPQAAAGLGLAASANDGDNLIIEPGSRSLAELIDDTKQGVLLFSFSGSSSSDGSFTGVAPTSFLVRNGKPVQALDSLSVAGNWFDILSSDCFEFSHERLCNGESIVPWLKIRNFHFS